MDVHTTILSGRMLLAGGMMTLSYATYSCLTYSLFSITEVIASSLVVVWGICLLIKSRNMEDSYLETESEEHSGRISPFYYELEPIAYKRDLPPIPRDIGREYDPVVLDKV